MKTIQVTSDIHTEFGMSISSFRKLFIPADITILAGDIVDDPNELGNYLQVVKEFSEQIIFVPGNHEYYRGYGDDQYEQVCKENNVHFLQKQRIEIDGLYFCGATLWSNITEAASNLMNDPHTAEEIREFHNDHVKWLSENIKENDIVITHHLPSFQLIHEKYIGHPATTGFASDLEYLIEKCSPSHWICGHTHNPFNIVIANTNIIVNPVGYPAERKEFKSFLLYK